MSTFLQRHPWVRYWLSAWPLARLLDESSRLCWADLVPMALGWDTKSCFGQAVSEFRTDAAARCRRDASECGVCYCGKFQTAEFQAEHVPEHYSKGITVEAVRP